MLLPSLLMAALASVPGVPVANAPDPSVSVTSAYVEAQSTARDHGTRVGLGNPSGLALGGGILTKTLAMTTHLGGSGPFDGAAMSQTPKAIVAMIVGFVVGLGVGHLIAGDKDGFVMFLIIDVVLIALQTVFWALLSSVWYIGLVATLCLVSSHIIQGLDAYGKASGEPLIQRVRESQIQIANAPGTPEHPATTRAFSYSF